MSRTKFTRKVFGQSALDSREMLSEYWGTEVADGVATIYR